jgi:predicted nuclease of restriction endonuclease-like (RecB) superfamily
MSQLVSTEDYRQWIVSVKERIQSSQIKAAIAVNRELLELYWYLGEQILEKQQSAKWGDGFLEQMSNDLLAEFPEIKGFSLRNLKYMRQWVRFWSPLFGIGPQPVAQLGESLESNREKSIMPQLVAQIQNHSINQLFLVPWGHNRVIMDKLKKPDDALFYLQKTIENNWSRAVLTHQIESKLHQREGQAINNFAATLPKPESDLAKQLLRDPYNFDFLTLTERYSERELEDGLTDHLAKFLMELGTGFAYVGRQYHIVVDEEDYYIDLLFYHLRLHCYVVVELKVEKFKPEHAGKLTFYVSAVDSQVRTPVDGPTLGILICKSKSDITVEYSLRDVNKPIGVSEYQITENLPEQLKSSLPTIEQIEAEFGGFDDV